MLVLNETNRVKTNKNCKAQSAILYLSLARMLYYRNGLKEHPIALYF